MKFILITLIISTIGCAHTVKPIATTPKLPTPTERAEKLSSTFTEKDLPLVNIEHSSVPAGQNGELQMWLDAGKLAPYSGVLVNPEGMAHIIADREAQSERADAALKKQRDLDLSKLNLEAAKLVVELETTEKKNIVIVRGRDDEIKRLQELHKEALAESKKPWKKVLIGVGSAVVGVGAGILIGNLATN